MRPSTRSGPVRPGCACRRRRRALRRRERRLGARRSADGPRPRAARPLVDARAPSSSRSRCWRTASSRSGSMPQRASGRRHDLLVLRREARAARPCRRAPGFVVDRSRHRAHGGARDRLERRLLAAHRRPRGRCTCSSTTATGSTAEVIGWDPYDDVGVLRVSPTAHKLVPVPLGNSAGVRVGQPVAAIGTPFGVSSVALGRGRLGHRPDDPVAHDRLRPLRRDPDRRADQPGQLGRAAARRRGRRDRDQRPDPLEPRVGLRGRGVRRPDRLGEALARASCSPRVTSPTPTSASQTEDLTPSIAKAFGSRPLHGAIVDSVARGGPAALGRAAAGPSQRALAGPAADPRRRRDRRDRRASPVTGSNDVARLVAERMVPGEAAWFTVMRERAQLGDPGHARRPPVESA